MNDEWVLCPRCGNKTRTKINKETVLEKFPLFCPKCQHETVINVKKLNISVIQEPDAKTQALSGLIGIARRLLSTIRSVSPTVMVLVMTSFVKRPISAIM